ncbi:MAG: VPLPA-CTERM sorting domain-containing protein, partial [Pseudomonadota bacterium]
SSFGAVSFILESATSLPVLFTNVEAVIVFASDDAAIDSVEVVGVANVPVPAALPLFGAVVAGFAGLRRRRKA